MKSIFFRSAFLFLGAILQTALSFASFSFPILLAMTVSITLARGFLFSWRWAVLAGVFFDSISLGRLGHSSMELVLLAAFLSLTSKELLFEYRIGRIAFLGGLVWIFDEMLRVTETAWNIFSSGIGFSFREVFNAVPWASLPLSLAVSLAVCAVVVPITFSFERYLELFESAKIGR